VTGVMTLRSGDYVSGVRYYAVGGDVSEPHGVFSCPPLV
jgi:hypothetical protein